MALSKGIESLPQDPLRDIMTRVGQQPGGAANIARAFSVSKTLRNFVHDGAVLRSISFTDSFPCFVGQYELLSEIGGLVMRCSREGNSSAKFLLSKVVLACSSHLCSAKIEASDSDASLSQQNCNLTDLHKATRLLDHLSVENTDPSALFYLVRSFLSKANVEDIIEMQGHLKNFVALFLVHDKKLLFQQFLNTLDELCEKGSKQIAVASDALNYVIEKLNELCTRGHNMMGEIDEDIDSTLLECLVEKKDGVVYEMLLKRVDFVENILKIVDKIAAAQNNHYALLVNSTDLSVADMLKSYLRLLIDHTALVQGAHRKLLADFSALFDL